MNKSTKTLVGVAIGITLAFAFTWIFLWLYPAITGTGGDAMSQGLLGTLVLVISVPVFALIGGVVAYKQAKKKD